MTASQRDVDRLLRAEGGIISRRRQPHLAETLSHLVRLGRLCPVLPGVYVAAELVGDPITRMRAAALWNPDAVLTGSAAAQLTFWPELDVAEIGVALRSRHFPQRGYAFERREVPPELVLERHRVRCTSPALTALDLCLSMGPEVLDTVLRTRAATVTELYDALRLTTGRRGNGARRALMVDSGSNAWSPAERAAQRLFTAEGIVGWVANFPLPLFGMTYYLDFAFPDIKLAVEIDGRAWHNSRQAFERDRWRQNDIVIAGWRVLRFTPTMLEQQPQLVVAVLRGTVQGTAAR